MPTFSFDLVSFWIGFLAATLFWFIVRRMIPLYQKWSEAGKQRKAEREKERLADLGDKIRLVMQVKLQQCHLAGALFPLSDIIQEPEFIAPPVYPDPDQPDAPSTIAESIVPYMPDWPEFGSLFHAPGIRLRDAISKGVPVCVIGSLGAGKTTALAHFGLSIIQDKDADIPFTNAIPLYIHVAELNLSKQWESPLSAVSEHLSRLFPQIRLEYLEDYLAGQIDRSQVVLLLDGLDELPPDQLSQAASFLSALRKNHPSLFIVTTGSPYFLDGLIRAGFLPLAIKPWTRSQEKEFYHRWIACWKLHVLPRLALSHPTLGLDERVIHAWIEPPVPVSSPLQSTCRVWAFLSNTLQGISGVQAVTSLVNAFAPDETSRQALSALAVTMQTSQLTWINEKAASKVIDSIKPPASLKTSMDPSTPTSGNGEMKLQDFLDAGILRKLETGDIAFTSPAFQAILAGGAAPSGSGVAWEDAFRWLPGFEAVQAQIQHGAEPANIVNILSSDASTLLLPSTLLAGRLNCSATDSAAWRSDVMKTLVQSVFNPSFPYALRVKAMLAACLSGDASVPLFLSRLSAYPDPKIRQLCALGYGLQPPATGFKELVKLLSDAALEVQQAACLALGALHSADALQVLAEALLHAEEPVRELCAEIFASLGGEGYKILQDAAYVQDIVTRRAAVIALTSIHEEWAREILTKVSVEDGQWVVRNAAAQALEKPLSYHPYTPARMLFPSESPWLLRYASEKGLGLPAGELPIPLLTELLQTGNNEQKFGALKYLWASKNETVVSLLVSLLRSDNIPLSNAAFQAIWLKAVSGASMPAPN